MIRIQVSKRYNFYTGLKVEGHASAKFGKQGNNILCAAVSAITQTLIMYLQTHDLLASFKAEKGLSKIECKKTYFGQLKINHAFDFVLVGLQDLQDTYPEEIEIVY